MSGGIMDQGDRYGTFREQLGRMKGQLDNAPSKADFADFRADVLDRLNGQLRAHEERVKHIMDEAFQHAAPGTEALARRIVEDTLAAREAAELARVEAERRTPAYRKRVPAWLTIVLILVAASAGQIIAPIAWRIILGYIS